jgi:WS/DGAT/MGAT family acyltransferase
LLLVDATPEPEPIEAPAEPWVPEPYDPRRHAAKLAIAPVRRARRWTLDATDRLLELSARGAANELKDATDLITTLARGRTACPGLPFNEPISANRSWASTTADLTAIKEAGKRHGGTVNDVVLAAVAGMLTRYLAAAGIESASLPRDPVALVPVSIRREGDDAAGTAPEGNRISIVFVDLPVGEPDPVRRVALVAERMAAVKDSAQVRAGALMVGAEGFAPPLMTSVLARAAAVATPLASDASPFNLVVTNVPGPQFPLYLNGSQVVAAYPVVPLNPADQGLNVGVFSYDGQVCFGLSADRDLEPTVEVARDALDAGLAEILAT